MSDVTNTKTRDYYDPRMCGTENYHLYAPFGKNGLSLLLTDSVKDFAQEKGAWWAINVVYSYLAEIQKKMTEVDTNIIFIHFDVDDSKCVFYTQLDSDMPRLFEQHIEFTDLDVSVNLYLQNNVLMFPSDY
jgi:hypothetical protein